jgi:hypothetical protein
LINGSQLQFEFLGSFRSFFSSFVFGRFRPFFFLGFVVSSFFSGVVSTVQGFISWFCSWLKFSNGAAKLSNKIAAPIENRLILSFIGLVDECDGPVLLPALCHRTPEITQQERTTWISVPAKLRFMDSSIAPVD